MLIPNPNNMTGLNQVQRSQQGFTLIELLVTIAILAVIVALATPSMEKQFANQRVKDSAKTIEVAFKDAKAQSVILGKDVTVTYTEASDDSQATIALSVAATTSSTAKNLVLHQLDDNTEIKVESLSAGDGSVIVFQSSKTVDGSVKYTVCDSSSSSEIPIEIIVDAIANVSVKMLTDNKEVCS